MPEKNELEKAALTAKAACSEVKDEKGYGACSASGCYCKSYSGSADTCSNCGHNYATHW
jgi:hypothetical protein